jgi:crossover junction endodeoxyribonuclease RuvC
MIIMGVDPGSRVTGYGIVSREGNRVQCVKYGAIKGSYLSRETAFPERLRRIHEELAELLRLHSPSVVAVEQVFHAVNARSALQLGHARGVILLAAAQLGIPLVEYSPLEVKKSVSGYGRADKEQTQTMVRILLNLREKPEPFDASDALAVALCHAFNESPIQRSRRRVDSSTD